MLTFTCSLVASVCYACIRPSWNLPQRGFAVLAGIGSAGPLTLLVAAVQYSVDHDSLSTATGLAFSARAIGGALGTAIVYTVTNSRIHLHYKNDVASAAVAADLPLTSVPVLLNVFETSTASKIQMQVAKIPGAKEAILARAWAASHWSFARAYRLGWWTVVPCVLVAIVSVSRLQHVKHRMTAEIEATIEPEACDTERGPEDNYSGATKIGS